MYREGASPLIKRENYSAPAFWIDTVELTFDLDPQKTRVLNKMRVRKNTDSPISALKLDGEDLSLSRVLVNGAGSSFKIEGNQLVLENLPSDADGFDLEIFTICNPIKNTQLSGLYVSNESFFTQCEAEGFRRITYFQDRPDVMASFTVTLKADKKAYPVLLSNGNLVESGPLEDGRHFAKWVDPHKKPCYLFALVAGRLVAREQSIVSRSGNRHLLQIYVRPGDLDKTEHAMKSLMASIAWDEARFGLTLDLERFMIVATSDFNMGAMENKGLNIFNTKYVLASQATATDADFSNIESVVGHEYFHNWTGNRITCRDWFQLSLKEGLTVFRDQEFSQDLAGSPSARAVKRIEDVRLLRTLQFAEDAGPMAHPVRPDSYVEINNFYTVTVYEKGAEVVRMMQTLVGRDGFTKGMELYFKRHDGQAVTCDDFANAIADASPDSDLKKHLDQFKLWYSQAGTPVVRAVGRYESDIKKYTLTLSQSCPLTIGQLHKEPFVIPVLVGLLSAEGQPLKDTQLCVLTEAQQSFEFENVASEPVPSIFRNFSAPVILNSNLNSKQLLTLLAHDTDPFNQWDAAQRLCVDTALNAIHSTALPQQILSNDLLEGLRTVLRNDALDAAFKEVVLTLPSESYLAEQLEELDPVKVHLVREKMREEMALELFADWEWAYHSNRQSGAYSPDSVSCGKRALSGLALSQLCLAESLRASAANANTETPVDKEVWAHIAKRDFDHADNMTERMNALNALISCGHPQAKNALDEFYKLFKKEPLVMDKWFAVQASANSRGGDLLTKVRTLMMHPDFEIKNPNRARSLIFSYCVANPAAFHRSDASGYVFWSERVLEIDGFNSQVAARLARALDRWKKLVEPYRTAAYEALKRVASKPDLSNDVREVLTRALAE
jgi:aminopeptidase N